MPSRVNRFNAPSAQRSSFASRSACIKSQRKQASAPVRASAESQQGNVFVKASVSLATSILSLVSLRQPEVLESASLVPPRSIREVEERLEADFTKSQYFVTGDVDLGLYSADCRFADPTISFRGSRRYQKNLRNLSGFFIDPSIELYSLERTAEQPINLQAKWRLIVTLKFPWRPVIDIEGKTDYTVDRDTLQIGSHVESWSVSALQALAQIFRLPQ